ncbi:hypothetical protein PENTCL1PPCAC_240 [Pristionchus entomophagus]|uniref:CHK kinase-like domain-containing protein n=1 Tax=Pristionchus entomophagus TaxID=358040 RepID=A0AAV5S6T1_9BILA|nr:hypothetical protein PENTCL1PPCAC_240 [Pristionchus entomophagus]
MSVDWLASALDEKLGVRPTIGESGPIIEASHGYMAQIKRVQLQWPIERDDLPKTVVLKFPAAGSAADAWVEAGGGDMAAEEKAKAAAEAAENMNKVQAIMHTAESQVYALFDENYPAPCPMPKTYASFGMDHDHPAIVMEDITGATITDIVDGWTEKQLSTLIDSLVGLHVMSFTTEKWKSFDVDLVGNTMDDYTNMTNAFATEILKRNPLPCLEKVQKNMLINGDWFKRMYEKYKKHPLSVLVHGDMWAPQFLWRGDTVAAIVDWQLTHVGSIMEDFLHLLSLGVSPSIRTRLTPALLQYYYTQLTSKLAEKGIKAPFSFEEMMDEYKFALPHAAGTAIFAVAMWSNSPVLKTGASTDEARIAEIFSRLTSILEECVEAYGW